jgi:ribonuclease HI
MTSIIIFTDGAVPNNQIKGNRTGGVGVFFAQDDPRNISFSIKEKSKVKVTNQVCELLGCIKALETIISTTIINNNLIEIKTDSMYIVNTINDWANKWAKNNWKKADNKSIQNEELIKKLYYLSKNLNVKITHVKAHTSAPNINSSEYFDWYGNYMADKLATSAVTKKLVNNNK